MQETVTNPKIQDILLKKEDFTHASILRVNLGYYFIYSQIFSMDHIHKMTVGRPLVYQAEQTIL